MRYKYDYSETQIASLFTVIASILIIFDIFYAATLNIYVVFIVGVLLSAMGLNRFY